MSESPTAKEKSPGVENVKSPKVERPAPSPLSKPTPSSASNAPPPPGSAGEVKSDAKAPLVKKKKKRGKKVGRVARVGETEVTISVKLPAGIVLFNGILQCRLT